MLLRFFPAPQAQVHPSRAPSEYDAECPVSSSSPHLVSKPTTLHSPNAVQEALGAGSFPRSKLSCVLLRVSRQARHPLALHHGLSHVGVTSRAGEPTATSFPATPSPRDLSGAGSLQTWGAGHGSQPAVCSRPHSGAGTRSSWRMAQEHSDSGQASVSAPGARGPPPRDRLHGARTQPSGGRLCAPE